MAQGSPTVSLLPTQQRAMLSRIARAAEQALAYNPVDGTLSVQTATVADGTTDDTTLTQKYATVFSGALTTVPWNWLGGKPTIAYTNWAMLAALSEAPGTGNLGANTADPSLTSLVTELEFLTDAPAVLFSLDTFHDLASSGLPSGWHLRIDGQPYLTKAATAFGGMSAPRYLKFDFGSRATRLLRFSAQVPVLRVAVGPSDTITPSASAAGIKALVVGDSYERGGNQAPGSTSGVGDLTRAWAWAVRDLLGWRDVRVAGIGGTGYLNAGTGKNTYRQRLTAGPGLVALHGQSEIVGLKSSQNDWTQGYASADVVAEALLCWQAYRAAFPNALIVVTGLHSQNTGPNSTFINGEGALKAAFDGWADPFSMFIPVSTDSPPWLKGTGKIDAPNGSGSNDFYLGGDGSHLAGVIGNDYSARRFATSFRSRLATVLANGGVIP